MRPLILKKSNSEKICFTNVIKNYEETFRYKRFKILINFLSTSNRPLCILDVGGTLQFWLNSDYRKLGDVRITLLNTFAQINLPPRFTSVVGDARNLSIYQNGSYDLVFSNSVIGHVGEFEDQKKMAKEVIRVGKRYFIQTPNKYFPIDWRTLVPFFHFLPVKCQAWCFRHFRVGTYNRVKSYEKSIYLASRIRNLSRHELATLFPGAKIFSERFMGFTKSFVAHSDF